MDKSQLAQVEAVWGLNRPITELYVNFLSKLVRGDLGLAMSSGVPIRRMIFERMPPTIELAIVSLIVQHGHRCLGRRRLGCDPQSRHRLQRQNSLYTRSVAGALLGRHHVDHSLLRQLALDTDERTNRRRRRLRCHHQFHILRSHCDRQLGSLRQLLAPSCITRRDNRLDFSRLRRSPDALRHAGGHELGLRPHPRAPKACTSAASSGSTPCATPCC